MEQLGVDVIFPAFFLLLVLDEVRSRGPRWPRCCGAAISGGLLLVTEPGYALLAATAGALVGRAARARGPETEKGRSDEALGAILAVTVANWLLKASGPLVLGDRRLPPVARRVVALMAPVLLAGLIVVELAGPDWDRLDGAQIAAWRSRAAPGRCGRRCWSRCCSARPRRPAYDCSSGTHP